MKSRTIVIAAALVGVLSSQPVQAEKTAAKLYLECSNKDDTNVLQCYNYLMGVWDGATATAPFCDRKTVTAGTLRSIFMKYIEALKSSGDIGLDAAVLAALASYTVAFPCRDNSVQPRGKPADMLIR
jgi:hypothetical protein